MKPKRIHKELRPLVDAAALQGWYLEGGTNHTKLVSPDGNTKIPLANAGTKRHVLNLRAQMRNAGIAC